MRGLLEKKSCTTVPESFDRFGISERDLARWLSDGLSLGADYAELYFETVTKHSISLDGSLVRSIDGGISSGCGVRMISGESVGYVSTSDLTFQNIARATRRAAAVSNGPSRALCEEFETRHYSNNHHENSVSEVAIEAKRELLMRADRTARAMDLIHNVRVGCSEEIRHLLIANSDGIIASDIQSLVRMDVFCLARRGNDFAQGSAGGGVRASIEGLVSERWPESLAAEAARHSLMQLEARDAPSGEMQAVLGPGLPGILLHEAIGHGLEADSIRKRTSIFSGMLGSRIGSSKCTVVDDGTLMGQIGTTNVDGEGSPPQITVLIENGVLQNYLTDKLSARLMGLASTGNGRRMSYEYIPSPRMTNTYMLPGDNTPEEIISSVPYGVFAKKFGGGEVDISSGQFVFVASEAYLIENGRITAPLKNCALMGNGRNVLTGVSMVGNDLQFDNGITFCDKAGQTVPVSVGIPTIKVDRITMGGVDGFSNA